MADKVKKYLPADNELAQIDSEECVTLTLVSIAGDEATVHVALPHSDPVELKIKPGSTINIPMSQLIPKGYTVVPLN